MKTIRYIMLLAVLVTAAFAQDKPETSTQTVVKEVSKQPLANEATELAKTGNEALRFILDKAKTYTGKAENSIGWAVDKAKEEAPETVRQFLVWRAWKHGVSAAIGLGFILVSWVACGVLWRMSRGWDDENKTAARIACFIIPMFFTAMILDLGGVKENALSLAQIKYAPRIYLIEQLTRLIK